MPDLSDKLREYMRKKNISQAELSNRSNISKTQISNILLKKACPRIDTIQLICNALEINISYLFDNDLYVTDNIDGSGELNRMDKSVKSDKNSSLISPRMKNTTSSLDEVNLSDERKALIEFAKKADLEQLRLVNQIIGVMPWDNKSSKSSQKD